MPESTARRAGLIDVLTRRTPQPKVSVAMITYRHEAFVRAAVESVLAQETDFPVELLIGEDCSPDRTGEIVRGYQERHPDRVRVLQRRTNLGASRNFVDTVMSSRGEYVALLDGDDYWTSPHKLQRQVDLLDARPDLAGCFHASERKFDADPSADHFRYPEGRKASYGLEDLARSHLISTASFVFRRSAFDGFPAWYGDAPCGDWPLFVLVAQHGDIAYLDEVMSVHRIHEGGEWFLVRGDREKALQSAIEIARLFSKHFPAGVRDPFVRAGRRRHYQLAHHYVAAGDPAAARVHAQQGSEGGYDPRVSWAEPFLICAKLAVPQLFRRRRAPWRRAVS